MTSPQPPNSCPYTFQRASTMATRNLVSPNTTTTPTTTPTTMLSISPNDMHTDTKPILQTRHTDHYERAAAEAARAGAMPNTTASSAAAVVGVQKQQSWKMSDLRAQKQGEVVEGRSGGMGYSSTGQK